MNPNKILLSSNATWHERIAALGVLPPYDDGVKAITNGELYPSQIDSSTLKDNSVSAIMRAVSFMTLSDCDKDHALKDLDEAVSCVIVIVTPDKGIRLKAFENVSNINLLYLILRYAFDVDIRKKAVDNIPERFYHLLRTASWQETNQEVKDYIAQKLAK